MILSLRAFHLSFPVYSTCLSQNASVSATEWGRILCAITEIQTIPWMGASRAISSFPGSCQVSGKDLIGFLWPATLDLFLEVLGGVFMEYCEIQAAFMED